LLKPWLSCHQITLYSGFYRTERDKSQSQSFHTVSYGWTQGHRFLKDGTTNAFARTTSFSRLLGRPLIQRLWIVKARLRGRDSCLSISFFQIPQSSSPTSSRCTRSTWPGSFRSHVVYTPSKKRLATYEHRSIVTSNANTPTAPFHQRSDGTPRFSEAHHQNLLHMMRRGVHVPATIISCDISSQYVSTKQSM
jgi:hypothetical protein